MPVILTDEQLVVVVQQFDQFAEIFRDPIDEELRDTYIAIVLNSHRLHDADQFCRLLPLVCEQHHGRHYPLPADIIDIVNPIT